MKYELDTDALEKILGNTVFKIDNFQLKDLEELMGISRSVFSPKRLISINRDGFLTIIKVIHDRYQISYEELMKRLIKERGNGS